MKPAVDEMFPEGAGPYVDLDEVGRWRRGAVRGGGNAPASLRGSPGPRGFKTAGAAGAAAGPETVT